MIRPVRAFMRAKRGITEPLFHVCVRPGGGMPALAEAVPLPMARRSPSPTPHRPFITRRCVRKCAPATAT